MFYFLMHVIVFLPTNICIQKNHLIFIYSESSIMLRLTGYTNLNNIFQMVQYMKWYFISIYFSNSLFLYGYLMHSWIYSGF